MAWQEPAVMASRRIRNQQRNQISGEKNPSLGSSLCLVLKWKPVPGDAPRTGKILLLKGLFIH